MKMENNTRSLGHVVDWIFDLDNTLYPRSCNLHVQMDVNLGRLVSEITKLDLNEARILQRAYYRDYGTTLNGLMREHAIDPDRYLQALHAIDYSPVQPHPELMSAIAALPGRKFILTNGDRRHVRSVLDKLGGPELFDSVFDLQDMNLIPKPKREAYTAFLERNDVDPATAVMFDDLDKNLVVPAEMGMSTVQVVSVDGYEHELVEKWELAQSTGPHVHHVTDDLAGFLSTCSPKHNLAVA